MIKKKKLENVWTLEDLLKNIKIIYEWNWEQFLNNK